MQSSGQLCLKGRFCIPELVTNHDRLRRPYRALDGGKLFISAEEAVTLAVEKLSECRPEDFAMLVAPDCTNEDLYIAQKFTRAVMGSHNIDTSTRTFYGNGFNSYLSLLEMTAPLSDLQNAPLIVCIGLDTQFGRSTVGVDLRKAINKGAKLVTVNSRDHNLGIMADKWLKPSLGGELDILNTLIDFTSTGGAPTPESAPGTEIEEVRSVAEMLKQASAPIILVGPDFINHPKAAQIFEAIGKLAKNVNAGVLPLPARSNLVGSILMGAYPELLPGGLSSKDSQKVNNLKKLWGLEIPEFAAGWNSSSLLSKASLRVLYLIGEVPLKQRPECDFLIYQNSHPADSVFAADLALPSAVFTEMDGTFINGEGRIQRVRKAVNPPGEAMPDWRILCSIAQKMGKPGFDFADAGQIDEEISRVVEGFEVPDGPDAKVIPIRVESELTGLQTDVGADLDADSGSSFSLDVSIDENIHRGFPISNWAKGLKQLLPDNLLEINAEDAQGIGVSDGDEVVVTGSRFEKIWPIKIVNGQANGTLRIRLQHGEIDGPAPCPVRVRRKDV
jgi:predicted molibdopterin-dependent oxidoreductase YjgC